MLTQEQLKHLNDEVMGLKPISPMPEFKTDEADSYAFTPEATKPAEPLPQEYQSAQVGEGFADLTFPSLTEENNTPVDFQQTIKEKLPGVSSFVGEMADRVETSLAAGAVEEMQAETGMKTLDAWKTYTNARPEVLREVRNISIETGIPEKVILYSPDSLNKARNIFNYRRKQMALSMPGGKNDPGMNEVTMDQLMEAYPGLDKIVKADSVTEAAIALENIENVRQMKSIMDAGVIGYKRGLKQREMQKVGMAAFEEGRDVTDAELQRYRELEDEYKNMLEAPDFFDSPLVSLAGRTAEQMPQQACGLVKGAAYGTAAATAAAGATVAIAPLTGGASIAATPAAAKWGFGVGMRVGYAEDMWTHSAAQRYLEYSQYKDENGKRVLTNAEAQAYASVAAALETGIEFANADTIVKVLKGNKSVAAEQIRNIVSGAKDSASFIAGMKQVLSGMKEVAFSETLEEGAQEISDRLLSNAAHSVWGGNIPKYSPGEIVMGGLDAMSEAFLPSLGFAAMAGGGGSFKAVRRAAALSELNNTEFSGWWKNVNGIGMINLMLEDKGILQYFKSDPEVAKKTLQGTVEGTEYENVNIDTEYARKKENGEEALREVAKAAGISDETVQAAIDTNATLSVPTAVYLQTKVNTENFALDNDVLSFSDDAPCLAKEQEYYEAQKARLESIMASADVRHIEQQQAAVDKIVEETFTDAAEREAATDVIMMNPANPAKGLRDLRNSYQDRTNELLTPVIEAARKLAPKKVRDADIRKMAMSILAGTYEGKVPDYMNLPEVQEYLGANSVQLNSLRESMDRLDAIKEKISSIDTDDLQTMEGMSDEAYEVYKEFSKRVLTEAPNKAVKRSAKGFAAMLARNADIYAASKRAEGNTEYTAKDYIREKFGLQLGGEYVPTDAETLFQPMTKENKTYVRNSEGNVDWGTISQVTADDGTVIKGAPVRVQIGFQVGNVVAGAGYTHISVKHPYLARKYGSVENAIKDLLQNFDFVLTENPDGREQVILGKTVNETNSELLILELNHDDGDYYTVIGIKPQKKNQTAQKKEKALSFGGNGTPTPASGDGAFFTPTGIEAGTRGDSLVRKDNVFSDISISEAEEKRKEFTYEPDKKEDKSKESTVRGQTQMMDDGKRILTVFRNGNESTAVHELGHIFLENLKDMAAMKNAPEQIVKDWETVREWLGMKPDQTTFTKEQHEKFAQGFEAYLMSGDAPTSGLKKIFRQFKSWLKRIYKDFLALGGKPSDEIQMVMGRMIASAEEVETAFQLRGSEYFEQAGATQQLDASSLAMYQRWKNEAQEYAEEKVLAQAMQDLTEKRKQELASARQKMEEDVQAKLLEEPVYKADALLEANPAMKDNFPAEQLGITYEEYQEQIKERGSLEDETKKLVDAAMVELEEKMPMAKIKEAAERAVTSSNYRSLYVAFERSFMMEKQMRTERLSEDIEKTLAEIEQDIAAEEVDMAALKGHLDELRTRTRWTVKEMNLINNMTMAAEQAAQKEDLKQAVGKALSDFRQLVDETREHVHVYRNTAYTSRKVIRQYAEEKMAAMTIPDATNVAKWRNSERLSGHKSAEALKKALNASLRNSGTEKAQERISKLWQDANDLKTQQLVYAEMAAIAQKNADTVRKKNTRLKNRMKSIRKNNSAPVQERYMYHHGLFVLGLEKQDAPVPQEKPDILSMFQYYADDMNAYFLDEEGNVWLPEYLIAAMAGNEIYKETGFKSLTMEQYGEFTDALDTIYRVGMDANKIKTVKDPSGQEVTLDVVIDSVVAETESRVYEIENADTTNAGSPTFGQRIWNKAREGKVKLTKVESVLEWMGPAAERYIYEPVNRARTKEMVILEQVAAKVSALWSKYTLAERSEMRSKKQFKFGTSVLTREEMMCVALNWGTEINKRRVMEGFRVTEDTVMDLLSNMTEKDWQTVEGMWELTNSFWDDTVATEEAVAGIAPKKEEAVPFTVMGKDGKIHDLKGGYYHIKYDPSKSLRMANKEQDDIARQNMRNSSAMNRNLGFTKQRSSGPVKHPLLLSFDVFSKNLYDVVHNICFREALRDVRRILTNDRVVDTITSHFGQYQAEVMQQWVLDCWAREKVGLGAMDQLMRFFRHKQTAAALGYNIKTALLNALNVFPMTHYLGVQRTQQAITDFYENREANWAFCLSKSTFLRERAETMERDAGEVLREEFHGGNGLVLDSLEMGTKLVSKSAFKVMALTDLMLANPLWLAEYQRVYQDMMASAGPNVSDQMLQRIDEEAISAGDKAVRKVFGSGDIKDLAPIQKGSELDKLLTMYYSYFNVVFNALFSGYAKGRMQSKQNNTAYHIPSFVPFIGGADVKIEIRPVVEAFLYWTVLTGVSEGLFRKGAEVAAGNDDGEDGWLMAMFKGWRDNTIGTIPYIRDVFASAMDIMMGERYYGARPLPAYGILDNFQRLWSAIIKDKKTKIDVFREGSRLANQFSGVSNTVTDAFATTAYWVDTDFDTPFYQYLAAVLLDKRIDKKKKKK